MIGQERLLENIDKLVEHGFPRFTIIHGPKNSGKKTVVGIISKKLNAHLISSNIKVDDVREIIKLAYKQTQPTVYLLPDSDKMSLAAKNALLKITEEPPKNAYFIMTVQDIGGVLNTLKSRGNVLGLVPYTPKEIRLYAELQGHRLTENQQKIVFDVCTNPGEVDLIVNYDIEEFYEFANTVIENIGIVNGANAFKIGLKFSYKEDDGKWDISLFWKTIMQICLKKIQENPIPQYRDSIKVTSEYLAQMNITGVNKSATMDMWILQMRGIWVEE